MKVQRYEGKQERVVLIGMVTDSTVLGRIAARYQDGMFSCRWADVIGEWCVRYYNQYNEAPGRAIENLYSQWAEGRDDKETARMMHDFLSSISDEYEREDHPSSQHIVDVAGSHFNYIRLTRLAEQIQSHLDTGEVDDAEKLVVGFNKVQMGVGSRIDLFTDREQVSSVFHHTDRDTLVEYPGALGHFFQGMFERDGFICFVAPEKTGKTWWLIDVAWRAMTQRRKVAFFEVGDMSEEQIKMRFLSRASRHPYRSPTGWPLTVKYPTSIAMPEKDSIRATVEHNTKVFKHPLDEATAQAACDQVMRTYVRSKNPFFSLGVRPTRTMTVADIKSELHAWSLKDGWVPDVVVIDYADILAPPPGSSRYDPRDQINVTWQQMRSLSQELHCLVVTASQADSASYNKVTLDRSNFSEDHRKWAHVTGGVGINVTSGEKEQGSGRLNWLVLREGDFSPRRCVHYAGCLSMGNPAMRSCW